MRKRKVLRIISLIMTAFILILPSCNELKKEQYDMPIYSGFSVHFLDVGEGNATLVHFPDGKNLLFDCGENKKKVYETVKGALNGYGVKEIDYLILSHPDGEHIGNAENLLKDFGVKRAYVPNVLDKEFYPEFKKAINLLSESEVVISKAYEYCFDSDYAFAFLSPDAMGNIYAEFNSSITPTETQLNNISPIIYLSYKGVRFLLTADATESVESKVVDDYNSSILKTVYKRLGVDLNLNDIDFYLVSGHGTEKSNSAKLLNLIKPKNAVISVGGDNLHGYPKSSVLTSLSVANNDINIYRTDYFGSVSVLVDDSGNYTVKVEADV